MLVRCQQNVILVEIEHGQHDQYDNDQHRQRVSNPAKFNLEIQTVDGTGGPGVLVAPVADGCLCIGLDKDLLAL